jgi:Na+-transporting NADH:ubiquinone oxidoreductase subunit NqrB
MFTKQFWIEASERALKTFAQTFLALIGAVSVFNAFTADWQTLFGVSLGSAFLSYLTSIVSAEIGDRGTPSLVATKDERDGAPSHHEGDQ